MKFQDMAGEFDGEGGKYLKLKDGANRVRIVSEAIKIWKAFDKENKKASIFMSDLAATEFNKTVSDPAQKAKKRAMMWVLNRENAQLQIAEFGATITNAIIDLSVSEDYAFSDLPPFDITITKKGAGMDTEYSVLPRPASELTKEEQDRVLLLEDLTEMFKKEAIDAGELTPAPGTVVTQA